MKRFSLIFMLVLAFGVCFAEVYEVKPGDTLWDISQRFYGTPFYWHFIWESNRKLVKNPHWIFPGWELYIPPREKLATAEVVKKIPPKPLVNWQLQVFVPYISKEPPRKLGVISKHLYYPDKGLYSTGDTVTINHIRGLVEKGELLLAYRIKEEHVKDPFTKKELGFLIKNVGLLKVLNVKADKILARVVYSVEPVMEGDLVTVFGIPVPIVKLIEPEVSLNGRVVKLPEDREVASLRDVVIVDLGKDDGLDQGDVLHLYTPFWKKEVGSLLVLKATSVASTCLVMRTDLGVRVGDSVATKPYLEVK